ncbi:unnamed protein product, partial [Dicrocoelium dendriticum]
FVPFRDFHDANSVEESKRRLSKAVLAEIPDQLVSYMRMQGIIPLRTLELGFKTDPTNGQRTSSRPSSGGGSWPSCPTSIAVPSAPPER